MKKIGTLALLILGLGTLSLWGQPYYMAAPEGYGAGTTGGGNASPVTVTNETQLKSALTATGSGVILVSGTIQVSAMIRVKAINKTLLGLPGARLINLNQTASGSGILYLQNGSSNVIIRNLIFEGPGAYDVDGNDNLTADGCTQLWVDHCEFQDGTDGNFDNKGNTDNVTISWCKFTYLKPAKAGGSGGSADHRFTNLVGSNASDAPADKHFSITFQNCYWANGCKERMPRGRNAQLHILNCYYNTNVASSTAIGLGGGANNTTCYVENTHFAKVGTVYKSYTSSDGGTVNLSFAGCIGGVSNVGSAPKPSYTTSVYPAANVAAAVTNANCGAGATLKVAPNGAISVANCGTVTALEDNEEKEFTATTVYPNPGTGTFFIEWKEHIKSIVIFNSEGRVVREVENPSKSKEISIQQDLSEGVYFIQVQSPSGDRETLKYIRSK